MTTLSDSEWLTKAYLDTFNRTPDLTSPGGAKYWLDQMASDTSGGHSRANVLNALQQSAEGKSYAADGVVRPGGVTRVDSSGAGTSTYSQADNEYLKSIAHLNANNANILNTIAANSFMGDGSGNATTDNVAGNYFQISDEELLNIGGGNNNTGGGGSDDTTQQGWWNQFADADAFKDFLFGNNQDDGMGDFMKFMMLMSIMRPQGGGYGGGYGGSQYGYGGLNPGGVQAAYDPLQHLQGMGNWFKTNFGSGSGSGGATTSTVNTGTAGN